MVYVFYPGTANRPGPDTTPKSPSATQKKPDSFTRIETELKPLSFDSLDAELNDIEKELAP